MNALLCSNRKHAANNCSFVFHTRYFYWFFAVVFANHESFFNVWLRGQKTRGWNNPNLSAKPKSTARVCLTSKLASARYSAPQPPSKIRRLTPTHSPHERCIALLGAISIFQANTSIASFRGYPRHTLVIRLPNSNALSHIVRQPSPKSCS